MAGAAAQLLSPRCRGRRRHPRTGTGAAVGGV